MSLVNVEHNLGWLSQGIKLCNSDRNIHHNIYTRYGQAIRLVQMLVKDFIFEICTSTHKNYNSIIGYIKFTLQKERTVDNCRLHVCVCIYIYNIE